MSTIEHSFHMSTVISVSLRVHNFHFIQFSMSVIRYQHYFTCLRWNILLASMEKQSVTYSFLCFQLNILRVVSFSFIVDGTCHLHVHTVQMLFLGFITIRVGVFLP